MQTRKIMLCIALSRKRHGDCEDCLGDTNITQRRLLASTLGSLISFTEEQLCYTAQGVNSLTFFTPPLWQSNYLKANKYQWVFFSLKAIVRPIGAVLSIHLYLPRFFTSTFTAIDTANDNRWYLQSSTFKSFPKTLLCPVWSAWDDRKAQSLLQKCFPLKRIKMLKLCFQTQFLEIYLMLNNCLQLRFLYILHALNNPGHYPYKVLIFFENAVWGKCYLYSEELIRTLLNENQIYVTSFLPSYPGI